MIVIKIQYGAQQNYVCKLFHLIEIRFLKLLNDHLCEIKFQSYIFLFNMSSISLFEGFWDVDHESEVRI